MRIFVMWSGDHSREVGEAASKLLKSTLTGAKVFISTQMEPGLRWEEELAENLKEANIGVACLTRENRENHWMHFESGMIAKMPEHRICPLRIGVGTKHIDGPLSRYQSTDALDKDSVFRLVESLNNDRPRRNKVPESSLRETFESQWEEFSEAVRSSLLPSDGLDESEPPNS